MYIHADFTCIHTIAHTVMLRRAVRLCDAISRSDLLMRDPRLFFGVKYNHSTFFHPPALKGCVICVIYSNLYKIAAS